ncbi:hypothetical protein C8A05DRAFT_41867 [Staphylotrichum tortipilum]|uniref:Uncharacterized protein n=1 Tax=Staphylotrichum tortipilum TaxID=2831512 RepID=A0AAN6MQC9_9PEZI|nr:hypothetical protein C8A05DRAFT_41867 [Staphylotrichum longicolle]
MPKRPPPRDPTPEPQPVRDLDLCKAVFSAAVSCRHSFPPECFQLVPLSDLLVAPSEDIAKSGSTVQSHDTELLRDQGSTVLLRQGRDYGVNRFLGILRNDILPLIDHEGLVKFRINFLRTKTWNEKALVEYYTVAIKYQPDGDYELDVWRAGTGRQHIATTDSQLWNLGDYLRKGRALTGAEPMHWTLAFHATERPDDPPIGVWKFDRTDFDDANLDLQQRRGYTYARIARLQ